MIVFFIREKELRVFPELFSYGLLDSFPADEVCRLFPFPAPCLKAVPIFPSLLLFLW